MEIVGDTPETRVQNPKQGGLAGAGPFLDATFVLQVQPGRIDWSFQAQNDPESPPREFPLLGSFVEWMETFSRPMLEWMQLAPPLKRLAFGAVLIHPVADRNAAYHEITNLVPGLRLDSPEISDFLYQINRPRPSTSVTDLMINRLSKWSAGAIALAQFTLHQAGGDITKTTLSTGTRLELDINTDPNHSGELSRESLSPLWGELVGLAREI